MNDYLKIFKKGIIIFTNPKIFDLSFEFIDFVDRCLTWDPAQRPTAESLLANHPFLNKDSFLPIESLIEERPKDFKLEFNFRDTLAVERIKEQLLKCGVSLDAIEEFERKAEIKNLILDC